MKKQYEQLCDDILYNSSLPEATSVHPLSGGIYCDACPPSEFAETAANQSARFLGTARQPEAAQTAAFESNGFQDFVTCSRNGFLDIFEE